MRELQHPTVFGYGYIYTYSYLAGDSIGLMPRELWYFGNTIALNWLVI